ncbi:pro-sigmaK processing inhibitor BofA family protein [Gracilibacillus alcaliphilus]|uniref:pro-sigmaK processing inhibitor BofA family protein n=1 Tax=Gracilibacillus alcaliphilus TaxID=1401441 RepID=UPI00195AA2B2|nr:pro-sigmaK processing inhibitor BofA family protein [Gracilibacillus alcaliphilus]MBM7679116.1 inhibitor of the pro-sigma K processing machinery [Gracilibacillus alcaliphilus]
MNWWIIGGIVILIGLLLAKGIPANLVKGSGRIVMKITIGVLFLFFVNLLGASFGLYVPINLFTAGIAGILGIPGIVCLTALHFWVI